REPVSVRQAQVKNHQVEIAGERIVDGGARAVHHGAGEPVRVQPFADERGDAVFIFDDQDACHMPVLLSSTGRMRVNVEPRPSAESRWTVPRWASAIARTIASPNPAPGR